MILAKTASAIAISLLLMGAVWVTGLVTPNVFVHAAAIALVTAVLAVAIVASSRRWLRTPMLASLILTLVAVVAAGAWLSRPHTVDEQVVTASSDGARPDATKRAGNTLVASGSFESLAHTTRGTARIIEMPDGSRKLTLQGFATDPGPDLFVYLVSGSPANDDELKTFINVGRLKGNKGDQQYDVPKRFDPAQHRHVYIWCRAFTVGFGRAKLET